MVKILGKSLFGRLPKSKKEEQEFGSAKSGIIMCPRGEAVYFDKSWHHNLEEYKQLSQDKSIRFNLCPADKMQREGLYEGILIIENIPDDTKENVVNLIKNIGQRAFQRDVLDRILDVDYQKGTIQVKTSENQLAISMGKQIHNAYKKSTIKINVGSSGESVARVHVQWE